MKLDQGGKRNYFLIVWEWD